MFTSQLIRKKCVSMAILTTICGINLFAEDSNTSIETWNMHFQSTYINETKPSFNANYSGQNSLSPNYEHSWTFSNTLYLGAKVWDGGEIYLNPEAFSGQSLSDLHGLGGFDNGEDQKGTALNEQFYIGRLFLRQTLNLPGGILSKVDSGENQLAASIDSRRVVLSLGKMSVIDIFDNNSYSHDPRRQFMNWSLMTYGAYDFVADTKGYSKGAVVELYYDDWALRVGRFMAPTRSNGSNLDGAILGHYGDQIELQHNHTINGQTGTIRTFGFINRENIASFQDAINYGIQTNSAPDINQVRKDQNKAGFGISLEQAISNDIGMFARYSWNDGKEEEYSYTEIDHSLSAGVQVVGTSWKRQNDTFGIGFANNGLSSVNKQYLKMAGNTIFLGDGNLNYKDEQVLEAYYCIGFMNHFWATLDAQRIQNPGYNADRGPASFIGFRLHFEI